MTTAIIASAPGAMPVIGHVVPLVRDTHTFLTTLAERGPIVRVRIGPGKLLVVCDPALTSEVLRDDDVFDKGGPFIERFRELMGNGVGTCPHHEHRRQRRLIQPAFHSARLPGYADVMTNQITAVINTWQAGQILDVLAESSLITSRTFAITMFSDMLPPPVFDQALDDLRVTLGGIYRRMFLPAMLNQLPTPGNRRYQRARTRLLRTFGEIIATRRTSGVDRRDLLSALLVTRADAQGTNQRLTDDEIVDQVRTFFIAATETTSTTLAWALYLVTCHPAIEKRLQQEVDEVLAGRIATFDDLPKLKLTGRIITETLRLYPPGWVFTRTVTADTQIGGHPVPAGTTLVYSPFILHHRSDCYPDPERFDPARWDEQQHTPPPRTAFVPFGGGARKCLGDRFGITQATLALASIAARWRLEIPAGQRVRPAWGATLHPRGLRMRLHQRGRECLKDRGRAGDPTGWS